MNRIWKPITEIASGVNSGKLSAVELVGKSLKLIDNNSSSNAIITKLTENAQKRAEEIDSRVAQGENVGRLAGVPFIAKDNFLVYGADTTASSNILKGFKTPYQSTAINRLEAEGAICVAKANLDAFAHGSSTENSDFFTTTNPHDTTRVAGGSSGGSAAAMALGLAPFALGTDTGGSIRQPASFTGTVGYKPTYGLVSRSGVVSMASSTDVIGPLASSVDDAALVLDVMSGVDPLDSTTIQPDKQGYSDLANQDLSGKKFGLVKEYYTDGLSPSVKLELDKVIELIRKNGGEVVDISLPSLKLALAVYYIICPAEVSSNLSRYDGQRYGFSSGSTSLEDSYSQTREQGFNAENKRRIMIGTYVLSSGYYDAYYKKAQTVRTKIINEFQTAFEQVDFLVGPTTPDVAFKVGENTKDPLKMYLSDVMTVGVNLAGIPAISLPTSKVGDLPVGFQVMAAQHNDRQLLSVSKMIMELTNA